MVAPGLALSCGDDSDDESSKPEHDGIISRQLARTIPLEVTRKFFMRQAGGEPPVKIVKQHAGRRVIRRDKAKPALRKLIKEKYGNKKVLVFPPETFTCLMYHGDRRKLYAWRFCFGEDDRLDSVSTAPPIK